MTGIPLPAVNMDVWTKLGVKVIVHDEEAFGQLTEAEVAGALQDARMFGKIELVKRGPIADFVRLPYEGESRL